MDGEGRAPQWASKADNVQELAKSIHTFLTALQNSRIWTKVLPEVAAIAQDMQRSLSHCVDRSCCASAA